MEAVPRMPMLAFELKSSTEYVEFGPVLKQYIRDNYGEDPAHYNKSCSDLEQLRQSCVQVTHDFMGCSALKKYYAQLQFLQTRFPMGEGEAAALTFTWEDVHSSHEFAYADVKFEQACILYNIGALHSILGSVDTRQSPEGMKVSCTHFQCAAWAFQHLRDHFSSSAMSSDMSHELLTYHYNLMLAQAQECILEKSMADSRKSTITAKVASQIVEYYKTAITNVDTCYSDGYISSRRHKDWKRRMEVKVLFYQCIMYFYVGRQAEEHQKMGETLAYYTASNDKLTESIKMAKNEVDDIQEALRFTTDVVGGKFQSAQKDNDFVYHEKVPALDTLPEVKGASLVKGIPFNPTDPEVSGPDIFAKLVPMSAHETSSLYSEEKAKVLRQIGFDVEEKNDELAHYLSSLQLDQTILTPEPERLPQYLLEKCAAMSVKTNAIKDLVDSMSAVSGVATEVNMGLQEIEDHLREEAQSEKEFQKTFGKRVSNIILSEISKESGKYNEGHKKGSQSNSDLHKAMNAHITNLRLLSGPLDDLQRALPTVVGTEDPEDAAIVQELQRLMSKVDEMKSQRMSWVEQLRNQIRDDDITTVVVTQETTDKQALFQEQLKKHEKLSGLIRQNLSAQDNILRALTDSNANYATVRIAKNEVTARREAKIQELISSVEVYEDLLAKSQKGLEFYRKLEANVNKLLQRCRGVCKVQQEERDQITNRYAAKQAPAPGRPAALKPGHAGGVPQPGITSKMPPAAPSPTTRPLGPSFDGPKLKDYLPFMKPGTFGKKRKQEQPRSPMSPQMPPDLISGQGQVQNPMGMDCNPSPNASAPGIAPAPPQGSPVHQAAGVYPRGVMPALQTQPGIPAANAVIPTSRGLAAAHMVPHPQQAQSAEPASAPDGYPASAANQPPMVTMTPTQPYQSPVLPQAPVQFPPQGPVSMTPTRPSGPAGQPHMVTSGPAMQPHIPTPGPMRQPHVPSPGSAMQPHIPAPGHLRQPHVPAPNAEQGPPPGHNMVLRQDSTNTVSAVDTPIAAAGQQTVDGHASRHHSAIMSGHQQPAGQYHNSQPSQMPVASNNPDMYASGVQQQNYQPGTNVQQMPPANQPQESISGPGQPSIPNFSSVPSTVSQYYPSNIGYQAPPTVSNQSLTAEQSISNMGGPQQGQQGQAMPHSSGQYVQPSPTPQNQIPPSSVPQHQNNQAPSQQQAPRYQTPVSQGVASPQQQYMPSYQQPQPPSSAYPDSGGYSQGLGRPNAVPPANVSQQAGGSPQHKPMYNTQQPQQYVNQQQPQYSNLQQQTVNPQQPQQQSMNSQQPQQQTTNPQQPQQQTMNPQQSQQYMNQQNSQQFDNQQQAQQPKHQHQSQQPLIQQQQSPAHQQQHSYPGVVAGQGQMSQQGPQPGNQQQQAPTQNRPPVVQPQQMDAVHSPQQPQLRTSQSQSPQIYGQQNFQATSQQTLVNPQQSTLQQNVNMQAGLQTPYNAVQNQSPGSHAVLPQQPTMPNIPNQQQVYSNQSNNAQNMAGPQQGLPPNQAYQQQPNTNLQGQVGYNANLPSNQIAPGQRMQNASRPLTFQPVMSSQGQQMYPVSGAPGMVSQNAPGQQRQAFIPAQGPSQLGRNVSGAIVQSHQPMGTQGVPASTTPMVPTQAAQGTIPAMPSQQAPVPQTSSVSAMPMDFPPTINSSASILKPAKLHRQNSDPNASSLDDILSSSPENARDATIPNPVLTPKVLTAQEIQQQKEEALKTQRKQPPKDPYQDKDVLSRFVAEVEKFEKTMSTLITPTLKGTSHLDIVWKEIMDEQDKASRKQSIAVARCYAMKNRDPDIMPFDETRVLLTACKDDYINASWINDLAPSCPKFITTQAPLPLTLVDFWLMIYQQGSEVIVNLVSEQEAGKKFPCYWPTEKGQVLQQGPISLTLQTMKDKKLWTERILHLNHSETKQGRTIVHLQYTGWPVSGLPEKIPYILQFISEVHYFYKQQRSLMKPVLVHCSNGIGRSGTFVMIYVGIQEINRGFGIIDIPSIAMKMVQKRRNIMRVKGNLKFIYDCILYHAEDLLMKWGILSHRASFGDRLPGPGDKGHQRTPSEDFILGTNLNMLQTDLSKMPTKQKFESTSSEETQVSDDSKTQKVVTSSRDAMTSSRDAVTSFSEESTLPDLVLNQQQKVKSSVQSEHPTGSIVDMLSGIGSSENRSRSGSNASSKSTESGSGISSVGPSPKHVQSVDGLKNMPLSLADIQNPNTFTLDSKPSKKKITKANFSSKGSGIGDTISDPDDPLSSLDAMWSIHKEKK